MVGYGEIMLLVVVANIARRYRSLLTRSCSLRLIFLAFPFPLFLHRSGTSEFLDASGCDKFMVPNQWIY